MDTAIRTSRLAAVVLCSGLAACGSTQPLAYSGIASAPSLTANTGEDAVRVPYRTTMGADWRTYSRVILDPVAIYRAPDQQFGDLSDADKAELATAMQTQFAKILGQRFALASDPAPHTLRVKLTLMGAVTNTPVLAPFTRVDIGGALYNGVQTVRGREGAFTGSVTYAVEIDDASTNRLLGAEVTKRFPTPFDIGASMGSLAAAKTGIDKGADALLAQLSESGSL